MPQNNFPPLRQLQLPPDIADDYITDEPAGRIGPIGRLNVFIGPNNSGKSRLLRSLFASHPLSGSWGIAADLALMEQCEIVRVELERCGATESEAPAVRRLLDTLHPTIRQSNGSRPGVTAYKRIERTGNQIRLFDGDSRQLTSFVIDDNQLRRAIAGLGSAIDRLNESVTLPAFRHIYIPTLRSLRPTTGDPASYIDRTIRDYFSQAKWISSQSEKRLTWEEGPIATGLEYYGQVKDHLLGDLHHRESIRDFEAFLSRSFFDGAPVALIPKKPSGNDLSETLWLKIGDEKEQPIHRLGDGVQQIVILTLPLFLGRDANLAIFVEEPDLYLHPGFQRRFIELVLDGERDGLLHVFVATHSAQFLDMTIDRKSCSIFRCRKVKPETDEREVMPRFEVRPLANDDRSILRELGVYNSSILLTNCTIWVEGVTDRWYLRRYLHLYQSEVERIAAAAVPPETPLLFLEDLHFSFVEYGGSAITHWSFLDNEDHPIDVEHLCGELLLVADGDSDAKSERHKKLLNALGDRFVRLQCKEIENTLSPNVLLSVVQNYERDPELQPPTPLRWEAYRDMSLGEYIEGTFFSDSRRRRRRGSYKEDSTVSDKDGFCRRAIAAMQTYDDLSDEAKRVAKTIYEFIRSHNADRRLQNSP